MGPTRLFPDELASGMAERSPTVLPIEKLAPNPDQPRRDFDRDELESLAASIREKGIIQPLIVRADPENSNSYQIVAGERRWRAAQMAQQHEVPVLVRELSGSEVLEIAIIENIQRTDLNPIEEASGYKQLMERFEHTQEMLSQTVAKSRSHIANLLRLLNLPEDVQKFVKAGQLSAGHARALVVSDDPSGLARQVVAHDLTVRQTEKLVKASAKEGMNGTAVKPAKDPNTRELEGELTANVGMPVRVYQRPGRESGRIVIPYKTLEQRNGLCRIFSSIPSGHSG